MMLIPDRIKNCIFKNFQQNLFFASGFYLLYLCICRIYANDTVSAGAIFAMAAFMLFLSNLTRFKRFKGFGVDMETWEDTQEKAEQLVEKLGNIYSIYSREIIMLKVHQSRADSGENWYSVWDLFDELNSNHRDLGQSVDLRDLEVEIYEIFIKDALNNIQKGLEKKYSKYFNIIDDIIASGPDSESAKPVKFDQLRSTQLELEFRQRESAKPRSTLERAEALREWFKETTIRINDTLSCTLDIPDREMSDLNYFISMCSRDDMPRERRLFSLAQDAPC